MTNIIINGQNFELTNKQEAKLREALGFNGKRLADVAVGDTFKVADVEFIYFGNGVAVTKDSLYDAKFGDTNNFKESKLFKKLKKEFLPKIIKAVGEENVLEFETDLITVDGLKDYGTMSSKISLPTFDFYRRNTEIFEKHKLDIWWWLATAWSTEKREYKYTVACVSPVGGIDYFYYSGNNGVRPFLIFNPNIFVSC